MGLTDSKERAVIDIDLSAIEKKRFRINEDSNRILELNVSDMSVLTRLEDATPKLNALLSKLDGANESMTDEDGELDTSKLAKEFKEIDNQMREIVDFIFDANVSEVCAPDGSMYDPFNGKFRFEHIIETLIGLYNSNIASEFKKMELRTSKHTAKYTKKKKK